MLKFLTHKLRTHSLNEEIVNEKAEERDSGTESDDEAERATHEDINTDVIMKWNEATDISMAEECCACTPRLLPAPDADQLYDHHSSEEELEVINGEAPAEVNASGAHHGGESRRRGASSPPPAAPEKRKWQSAHDYDAARRTHSDDDDDNKIETPVRFRSSPPRSLLRPRRMMPATGRRNPSPTHGHAAAATHHECERRVRRRHRPQLDFDKMQQLKVGGGGVTSWRQVGGTGGELSVFCW